MKRVRTVGTITFGLMLITFGVLFLINVFTDILSYVIILKLWPIIFIALGLEVLAFSFVKSENALKYDKTAFFLLILLSLFAVGMAGCEFIVSHVHEIACWR